MLEKTRPWHVFRAIRDMRRLVEELRPELIFSQLHYVNMVTGTALARSRYKPRWVCRQSNDPRREMKGPFATWARWALRRADRVIACSRGVSQATVEHLKIDPEKITLVDNLADVPDIERLAAEPLPIEKRPGTFTFVHAGRLHGQKNQELLLEAFSRLQGRPAELWMLGEGPLSERLHRHATRLGIANQVRWLGFRTNPFPFFKAADCAVLSSDYEGLPNVVIESMICGTPAISTRCPYGPDELIEEGVSGHLVPVGDADALGRALERLATDPEHAQKLGAEARRQAIERFGGPHITSAYEELFETVVRGGASRS